MSILINTKIGKTKKCNSRVWFEGNHVARGGIEIGTTLYMRFDDRKGRFFGSSKAVENPAFTVTVSKRTNNGAVKPLVEIKQDMLAEKLGGEGADIRIILKKGKVIIRKYIANETTKARFEEACRLVGSGHGVKVSDLFKTLSKEEIQERIAERSARATKKLTAGEDLTFGCLFHGGGTLDRVLHDGFVKAGVNSYAKFVTDMERTYLSASVKNNADLWRENTVFVQSPVEKINFSDCSGYVDVLVGGVPCTGASPSGATKNKLEKAEYHKISGMAFVSFCEAVMYLNPISVQFENVRQYAKTDGYLVICDVLEYLGYNVVDGTLNGADFGSLEARERLCMIATSEGMEAFNFDDLEPFKCSSVGKVSSVFDQVSLNDDCWKSYDYLKKKEVRDKAAGKGFARTLLNGDEESVPVIKRLNHKAQSDGVFIQHPTDDALSRLPKKLEHADFKLVPHSVVEGLCETLACEILGQGVIGSVFDAVGYVHATTLKRSVVCSSGVQSAA